MDVSKLGELAGRLQETKAFQDLPPPLQTALFLGALALLPALLVTTTSFTRIIIVLSFVRKAVASQETPPNQVLTGLALFLTLFTMGPTLEEINNKALTPYLDKKIQTAEAVTQAGTAMHKFMLRQTRRQDLALFLHMADVKVQTAADTPFRVLVPAFIISELKTAFIMGFCIYLPFLLVDLVVSSVLTSMGMIMMPPVLVSTPCKILLFVLADGWHLIARGLCLSFV
jgi:flagellar biosynthesis protein FliP